MDIINKVGGRKFILVVAGLVLLTGLFLTGKLTEGSYKDMVVWLVGLFTGGNIGEHTANAFAGAASQLVVPADQE